MEKITRDIEIERASERMKWLPTQHDRLVFQQGACWADNHPKSPWISVHDHMPPSGVPVLATDCAGTFWVNTWNDTPSFTGWARMTATPLMCWMPIPEPPKEGGERP